MARLRFRHTILPMAAGFGFYNLGRNLELSGDVAVVMGRSGDALANHLAALIFTLLAFGCFIFALYKLYRGLRGGNGPAAPPPSPTPSHAPSAPVDAEPAFDPDAIIARYLAERNAPGAPSPPAVSPVRPSGGGFGRKAV